MLGACLLPDGGIGIVLPDGGIDDAPLDAGFNDVVPNCATQGDDGGGGGVDYGDGGVDYGDGGVANPALAPVAGSGKDGDNGTAVLVMLRVDQGTVNIATNLQSLLKQISDARDQGFKECPVCEPWEPGA